MWYQVNYEVGRKPGYIRLIAKSPIEAKSYGLLQLWTEPLLTKYGKTIKFISVYPWSCQSSNKPVEN